MSHGHLRSERQSRSLKKPTATCSSGLAAVAVVAAAAAGIAAVETAIVLIVAVGIADSAALTKHPTQKS